MRMSPEGELNRRQRWAYARHAVLAQAKNLLPRTTKHTISAVEPTPPDSPYASAALTIAVDAYSPGMLRHCLRCWWWADLFAQIGEIRYDPELLYVSCLLHDLTLTDTYRPGPSDQVGCFAVHGGRTAERLLATWDAPTSFATQVGEAITSHMDPTVALSSGALPHLLHESTYLDVVGARANELEQQTVLDVITKYPRDGFAAEVAGLMRREARERPRSRAACGWRLGMPVLIKHNPIERLSRRAGARS